MTATAAPGIEYMYHNVIELALIDAMCNKLQPIYKLSQYLPIPATFLCLQPLRDYKASFDIPC